MDHRNAVFQLKVLKRRGRRGAASAVQRHRPKRMPTLASTFRIGTTRLSNDRWEWWSFERLRRAIREEPETTKLLVELGARAGVRQKEVQTLERE